MEIWNKWEILWVTESEKNNCMHKCIWREKHSHLWRIIRYMKVKTRNTQNGMDFRGSRMSGFIPVRVIGPTVSSRCDGCPLSQYLGDVLAYLFWRCENQGHVSWAEVWSQTKLEMMRDFIILAYFRYYLLMGEKSPHSNQSTTEGLIIGNGTDYH